MTDIGNEAFGGCSNLSSVVIPDSVKSIGDGAFEGCNITSLTISSQLKIISDFAFASNKFSEVVIPSGVTRIGRGAFRYCSELSKVVIPNSVNEIGESAFEGCEKLTSVLIPDSVTIIGKRAFSRCSNIEQIIIPDSVERIDAYAFEDCSRLTTVGIGKGLKYLGLSLTNSLANSYENRGGVFYKCPNLQQITIDEANKFFCSPKGCNAIIRKSDNALIVACNNTHIPDTVEAIAKGAFSNCKELTSIHIPASVKTIELCAFDGCAALVDVTMDGVETLADGAFRGCTALKTVKLSDAMKVVSGFIDCAALESIDLPPHAESIGASAFSGCTSLKTINLPATITVIGGAAFKDCTLLTSITLPPSLRMIYEEAFSGTSIKSITLPKSLLELKCRAFNNLDKISVEDGNTRFDSREDCNAVINSKTNVLILGTNNTVIPNTVTEIGGFAFSGYKNLKDYCNSESVTKGLI